MRPDKIIVIVLVTVSILVAGVIGTMYFTFDKGWICEDGKWVSSSRFNGPMPKETCQADPEGNGIDNKNSVQIPGQELIRVFSPVTGDVLNSPIALKGEARGNWFFEASFPARLEDENGRILAELPVQADGDWMMENFVPFSASIDFNVTATTSARLVLMKDNPSGLPEHDASTTISLTLLPDANKEKKTLKIFFPNSKKDPGMTDCGSVHPVTREIDKTLAVGQAAINELLLGPSIKEANEGYFTSINQGSALKSIKIDKGAAYVDFDKKIEESLGGSCRVTSIRAQITETLKQFPTVNEVIISVEGKVEDALQP